MQTCPLKLEIAATWDGQRIPSDQAVHIQLDVDGDHLIIDVHAPFYGDPPPLTPAGPTDGLWEFEVVELFIGGSSSSYIEVELGPHGHHLVLQLADVRQPTTTCLPIAYTASIDGYRWRGSARLPLAWLPEGPHRINATAISGVGQARRYLSLHLLPGDAPDFHQPARFLVKTQLT